MFTYHKSQSYYHAEVLLLPNETNRGPLPSFHTLGNALSMDSQQIWNTTANALSKEKYKNSSKFFVTLTNRGLLESFETLGNVLSM